MPDAESAFSPNKSSSSEIWASGFTWSVALAKSFEWTLGSSTSIGSGTDLGSITGISAAETGAAGAGSMCVSDSTVVEVAGISGFVCGDCSGLIVVDVVDVVDPSTWYLRTYFSFVGVSGSGYNRSATEPGPQTRTYSNKGDQSLVNQVGFTILNKLFHTHFRQPSNLGIDSRLTCSRSEPFAPGISSNVISRPNRLASSAPVAVARDSGIRSSSAINRTKVENARIGAGCKIGRGDEYLPDQLQSRYSDLRFIQHGPS
jgi:hypothetical protein